MHWLDHGMKSQQFLWASLQQHLHSLRDSIQFTMEMEAKGELPFVNVLVRKENNMLATLVYRNNMHTGRYFHFQSNHHPWIKTGIISCLKRRAVNVCNGSDMNAELHAASQNHSSSNPPQLVQNTLIKDTIKMPHNRPTLTRNAVDYTIDLLSAWLTFYLHHLLANGGCWAENRTNVRWFQ